MSALPKKPSPAGGGLLVALAVFGCFSALSCYSWAKTHAPMRHVMEDRVVAARPVHLWRTRQAAALAEVYGISPDEVGKPIRIWSN